MDSSEILQHKPAKLLVVDDSNGGASLLKRRLSMYGHEVFVVHTKEEALDALQKNVIDVIFLNMFLRGRSTYGFLENLKNNPDYQNIPLIMISSDNDTDLVVKCIEAGADDYLIKPLNQTLLRARLSNCIARKEAYDKETAYLAKIKEGQQQIAAQEKMASVGMLVTSISNELKNPLNFVINFAEVSAKICDELLQKISGENLSIQEVKGDITEHLKLFQSNVAKISEYGRSADQIIRFMLDQSNVNNDRKHPTNINKVISQTIDMLFSAYKSRGITNLPHISPDLDNAIPHVELSIQSFSKVIYNVLDNAVYAVSKKFDDLSQAKISVVSRNHLNDLEVTIRDNGIGIPEGIRGKIFEPFFTTKESSQNPGLGLSTALEIIRDLRGNIVCSSVEGEFAEFKITFPKK